jgi:stage II sporulation protein D
VIFPKLIRIVLVSLCLVLVADEVVTAKARLIRVAVLREEDHFTMAVQGRYDIMDLNTGKKLDARVYLRPVLVSLQEGKTRVGDRVYDAARLAIAPRREALVSINDGHFRGDVIIINNKGANFTVVNSIDLERYIRGVLYHEVSDKWPLEAIMAQAVATRTYALYSMEKFAARDYDVTNDVYSQVYGGRGSERYRTNVAVRRTGGQVLVYQGKIFPAFFHANSGGVTEDASELWDIDIVPLKGGIKSPFSMNSPHYQWRRNFRLKDIQDKLNARGYEIGLIKDIQVLEYNKSGRVRKLKIISRDGKEHVIEGKIFRDVVGPNVLRSNKYDIEMKGWYVDFVGNGWGHGVGMCQWGAYGMALMHYNYRQILEFYYPSSEISKLKDVD